MVKFSMFPCPIQAPLHIFMPARWDLGRLLQSVKPTCPHLKDRLCFWAENSMIKPYFNGRNPDGASHIESKRLSLTMTTSMSDVSEKLRRCCPGFMLKPKRPLPTIRISRRLTSRSETSESRNLSHVVGFASKTNGVASECKHRSKSSESGVLLINSRNSSVVIPSPSR